MKRDALSPRHLFLSLALLFALIVPSPVAVLAAIPAAPEPPPAPICGGVYPVAADTTVKLGDPTVNLGGDPALQIAVGFKTGLPDDHVLLAFQLPKDFPYGQAIQQAQLELTLYDGKISPQYTLYAASIPADWDEYKVNWNGQPAAGQAFPPVTYGLPYVDPDASVLRVDVTALANLWSTGAIAQAGVALVPAGDTDFEVRFHSRESSQGAYAPRLVVNCALPFLPTPVDGAALDNLQMAGLQKIHDDSLTPPKLVVERGVLRWGEFTIPVPQGAATDPTGRTLWFLKNYGAALRLPDPLAQLQLERRNNGQDSIFFRQRHQGIPVYPGKVAVRVDGNNVTGVLANYLPDLNLSATPTIPAAQAEQVALSAAGKDARLNGETRLRYVNHGLTGGPDLETHLVWQVNLAGDPRAVFVDAHSGQVRGTLPSAVAAYDLDIENVNGETPSNWCLRWNFTYADDHECSEEGCIASPHPESGRAWWSMRAVDYFYRHYLNRDSYDDDGAEIQMYVNLNWRNAQQMSFCHWLEFGVGYTVQDIVGHEFTHAVTEHEADLEYENESGALNESFSDILAELSETPPDWLFGEGKPGGASRSFINPPDKGQPDFYHGANYAPMTTGPSEDNDYGGVHTNSGVQNKAAWLIIHGGSFNGHDFNYPFGIAKGAKLYYFLEQVLTANATFGDAAGVAVYLTEIHSDDFTAQDVCTVRNAYHAVGLRIADTDCDGLDDVQDPDADNDGVPNSTDNCIDLPNPGQQNADGDLWGDLCDPDDDNDGNADTADNCPLTFNPYQTDWNGNGVGNACEDADGDGRMDDADNCNRDYNPDQRNLDRDNRGDVCDPDDDGDGRDDTADNCPLVSNSDQRDGEGDGFGDACDLCPGYYATTNVDTDGDGIGNACDRDNDNDGIRDDGSGNGVPGDFPCTGGETLKCDDNCPKVANPDQLDIDGDGAGSACDREEGIAFGRTVSMQTLLSQSSPLSVPLPEVCVDCLPGYLPAGYRDLVSVAAPVPVYAQVVDTDGQIVAFTAAHPAGLSRLISYEPAPYAFVTRKAAARAGTAAITNTPPDAVRYSLEVYPLGDYDPTKVYEVETSFEEKLPVTGQLVYLPLLLR